MIIKEVEGNAQTHQCLVLIRYLDSCNGPITMKRKCQSSSNTTSSTSDEDKQKATNSIHVPAGVFHHFIPLQPKKDSGHLWPWPAVVSFKVLYLDVYGFKSAQIMYEANNNVLLLHFNIEVMGVSWNVNTSMFGVMDVYTVYAYMCRYACIFM